MDATKPAGKTGANLTRTKAAKVAPKTSFQDMLADKQNAALEEEARSQLGLQLARSIVQQPQKSGITIDHGEDPNAEESDEG